MKKLLLTLAVFVASNLNADTINRLAGGSVSPQENQISASANSVKTKTRANKPKKTKTRSKTKKTRTTRTSKNALYAGKTSNFKTPIIPQNQENIQSSVPRPPKLYSYSALVIDILNNKTILSKNAEERLPIASITKLMTAMVLLDSGVDLDEYITISDADIDRIKNTYSRLRIGTQLRRRDLLLLALMSSENRAAHAIARTTYSGGTPEFVKQMNIKAKSIGAYNTIFYDGSGLTPRNQSTAKDVAKIVKASSNYPQILADSTTKSAEVILGNGTVNKYRNSNRLVVKDSFPIEISKTGFINEAGPTLALYAVINNRPIIMVFLNSGGKSGRLLDAVAVKNYISKLKDT